MLPRKHAEQVIHLIRVTWLAEAAVVVQRDTPNAMQLLRQRSTSNEKPQLGWHLNGVFAYLVSTSLGPLSVFCARWRVLGSRAR